MSFEADTPAFRSLYVHFPFCESKCHYCDFYSIGREKTGARDADVFEDALKTECGLWADTLALQIDTIFLGGGTPSMTPPESMARALAPLALEQRIHTQTEFTMEANPSSVSRETLAGYRALGVNRVSMGVQALNDELLLKLGRVHSRTAALKALDTLFNSGLENVSVDLLCGVPGQSLDELERALATLTQYPITHLSCYLLTLPKSHRMHKDLPDENVQLEHLLLIDRWMRAQGFHHYEISNFCKPGREARHNLAYWTHHAYLGLGPSAHSFFKQNRWKNINSLHGYARRLAQGEKPIEWTESLSPEQENLEKWLLALRLSEGFPRDWLETPLQRSRAQQLEKEGLLELHPHHLSRFRLTPKGFALSDAVIQALV